MCRIHVVGMWMMMGLSNVWILIGIYVVISLISPYFIGEILSPAGEIFATLAVAGTICLGVAMILWSATFVVEITSRGADA